LHHVPTQAFYDQRPGTSGLRKAVHVFQQPGYVENFAQCIFDTLKTGQATNHWSLGGDGRYFSHDVLQIILKVAAANRVQRMLVGLGGILSTPAASCMIRKHRLHAGILLTAIFRASFARRIASKKPIALPDINWLMSLFILDRSLVDWIWRMFMPTASFRL
jgi:phosphoglucomutase